MKRFRMKADITFDAASIEHAIRKLADHFEHEAIWFDDVEEYDSESSQHLDFIGELVVEPEVIP